MCLILKEVVGLESPIEITRTDVILHPAEIEIVQMFLGEVQGSCEAVNQVDCILQLGTEELITSRRSVLRCECEV